jgi:hypothetical protein
MIVAQIPQAQWITPYAPFVWTVMTAMCPRRPQPSVSRDGRPCTRRSMPVRHWAWCSLSAMKTAAWSSTPTSDRRIRQCRDARRRCGLRSGRGKHDLRLSSDGKHARRNPRLRHQLGGLLHPFWSPRYCERNCKSNRSCGPRHCMGRCDRCCAGQQPRLTAWAGDDLPRRCGAGHCHWIPGSPLRGAPEMTSFMETIN